MRRRRVSVARSKEKNDQTEEFKSGKENDEDGTLEDFYDTEVMVFNHSSVMI